MCDVKTPRDHGGGLDAAVQRYGGVRIDWVDLSTGINPLPYPMPALSHDSWTSLPDQGALQRLLDAARRFWSVPDSAQIVAAPGASALIARLPYLVQQNGAAYIPRPTYNEHAAAVAASGTLVMTDDPDQAAMHTYVHPNNPDGRMWDKNQMGGRPLTVIDESFCDVMPDQSHITLTGRDGIIVLKSFGKFWGLAGLRLGFAIATPGTFAPPGKPTLQDHLGPWPVSGPALQIGAAALENDEWAARSRTRLAQDAGRLDQLMASQGAQIVGGTSLFRLYEVDSAANWQGRLARHHIWSRVFPYNDRWLRLGLPHPDQWTRIEAALT